MASLVERLDSQIAAALADWSVLSTILALLVVGLVLYPIIYPEEPDTHPLLLARQASASAIRNKGESAVYRSPEIPHGYPLKSGLNVKDEGAPRWASGKDGDLRDIWREVLRSGSTGQDGKPIPKGLIMSVYGKEEVVEHDIDALTNEIGIIGKHLQEKGAKRVAIYLPNSVEYLMTLFACAFYGMTPVLLPYNQPHPEVYKLLALTEADSLVCAAGTLPPDDVARTCPNLRSLVWVVEKTSRHMDWSGTREGAQVKLSVGAWHDIVTESQSSTPQLPDNTNLPTTSNVVVVWHSSSSSKPEIVSFSQANLVAATAGLISAIPLRQRFSSADLFLPADTFTHTYVLCLTLAALFTHASIAINSVALPGVQLALARRGVAPTVIVASAETLAALHKQETSGITSLAQNVGKYSQAQTMSAGRMPTDGILFKMLAPSSSGNEPGQLRLILASERLGAGSPPITSTMLSDLRIFTRSRIIYALTAAKVAGAVAQTNVFDYRRDDNPGHSHFGIPLSSVEVKFLNKDDAEVGTNQPRGEILVSGPAVSGGSAQLGVQGRIREDCTIAYV